MIANFKINGAVMSFNNIISCDLSIYDEIMITSKSTPEFDITFTYNAYNVISDDQITNDFSSWFNQVNLETDKVYLELFDNNNYLLGKGSMYEYDVNYSEFQVKITFKSELSEILAEMINLNRKWEYTSLYRTQTYEFVSDVVLALFTEMWNSKVSKPFVMITHHTILFNPIVSMIMSKFEEMASAFYILKIVTVFSGSRNDFLKQISMILNAKISYSFSQESFIIIQFEAYSESPTMIEGYIKNVMFDVQEQAITDITLLNAIQIYRGGAKKWSWTGKALLNPLYNRIKKIAKYKKYTIWGYHDTILYTSQTISIEGKRLYLKEIEYDKSRLDDIKCFDCEAVEFI